MKKKLLLIFVLLIILAGFFSYRVKIKNLWLDLTKEKLPEAMEYQQADVATQDFASDKNDEHQENTTHDYASLRSQDDDVLPRSQNLDVPFTPQAPHAIWDETFKEACEEAASLIVHYYYQGKEFTADSTTDEILKMVEWQIKNWGGHFDLTVSQTAEMIKEYWGYEKVEVIDNPTIDDIKRHLSEKRPVIVPAAGRELGNPYFRTPGPIYHMLVIKGYTEDKFITNDPGTKRGEDYLYDYDVIMNAMHDWDEDDINQGEKRIIVIDPK